MLEKIPEVTGKFISDDESYVVIQAGNINIRFWDPSLIVDGLFLRRGYILAFIVDYKMGGCGFSVNKIWFLSYF